MNQFKVVGSTSVGVIDPPVMRIEPNGRDDAMINDTAYIDSVQVKQFQVVGMHSHRMRKELIALEARLMWPISDAEVLRVQAKIRLVRRMLNYNALLRGNGDV